MNLGHYFSLALLARWLSRFHLFYILHSNCINVTLVCGDEAHKSSLMFKVTYSRIGEDVFDDSQAGAIDDNDEERQYR